ncbi:hypothetical protein Tco_0526602 [Tanacetum coccineum]
MSKNDMKNRICTLSKNDLKDLVKTYRIPQDLHPRLPDPGFTMDRLPGDATGIYTEFLRVIPDFLTWRHSCSCVSDDLPTDGYDRNDVERLCARLICLREMREEVLVRSRLSSVWFNKECVPVFRMIDDNSEMSIYDFMTLPSWGDAKVVEESHHLSSSLLERVPLHTTAPAAEGTMISFPTAYEVASSLPDPRLAKKSKDPSQAEGVDEADLTDFCAKIENSLERNEGISTRVVSAPTPRLGKRLGAPPSMAVISAFGPSHVGTLFPASTSGRSFSLGGVVVNGHVGKSEAEVVRRQMNPLDSLAHSALARDAEYDQIPEDDFGTVTRSEEIELTLFPLAPGPYHMPYPYEGVSSPLYTKEEWGGPHAPESNILCKDIFKDLDVCRKALDQTITPAELRRAESLLPLEMSNRVNVLSALLVSHGYELNSRYTNLVSSRARVQEKLDQKKGDVRLLRSEVTSLENKLEKLQRDYDALGQENREICSQRDATSEEVKKLQSQLTDAKAASVGLTEELTRTGAKLSEQALTVRDLQNELALERSKSQGLVRRLLSSDEFHAALAHVASLGINYGVERVLRMGRTDADFEMAVQKVSNFQVGAKADFDKALVYFPTTPFPFLGKVAAAAGGTLFDVAQILPDKFARSAASVSTAPSGVNEASDQVPL